MNESDVTKDFFTADTIPESAEQDDYRSPINVNDDKDNPKLVTIGLSRRNCGKKVFKLLCQKCFKTHYRVAYCGHRLCPRCAREAAQVLKAQLLPIMKKINSKPTYGMTWKLITLTTRKHDPGWDAKRSLGGINKFIRNILEPNGLSGIAHLELAPGGMVHWHLLWYGKYIKKSVMKNEWMRLTGSYIVDIEPARNGGNLRDLSEICHYITKFAQTNPELLSQFWKVVKHRRILRTFGLFYDRQNQKLVLPCIYCGGTRWKFIGITQLTLEIYDIIKQREKLRKSG